MGYSYPVLCRTLRWTSMQAHIGEHILRSRPTAVVVETAITPQHGAMTGNVFSCQGEDLPFAGPFARMLCYCACQLKDFPAPAETSLWEVSNTKVNRPGQNHLCKLMLAS
jgi:hypothetical protein